MILRQSVFRRKKEADFDMRERLVIRRVAACLRGAEGENARCVQQITVRWASGGAANPAREAKAASPSKVVKKGGAAAKDEGLEKRDKFANLLQSCLEAPSPVRHLKEKDRLRELEREKLGLVSKEKERALERDKAKAKAIAKEKKKAGWFIRMKFQRLWFSLSGVLVRSSRTSDVLSIFRRQFACRFR